MEDLLAREEELMQQLEELKVKEDIRIIKHQPIILWGGLHETEVVRELQRTTKSNAILLDAVFTYGRLTGVKEERQRRANRTEDYVNLLRENKRLKECLAKARDELKGKVTVW